MGNEIQITARKISDIQTLNIDNFSIDSNGDKSYLLLSYKPNNGNGQNYKISLQDLLNIIENSNISISETDFKNKLDNLLTAKNIKDLINNEQNGLKSFLIDALGVNNNDNPQQIIISDNGGNDIVHYVTSNVSDVEWHFSKDYFRYINNENEEDLNEIKIKLTDIEKPKASYVFYNDELTVNQGDEVSLAIRYEEIKEAKTCEVRAYKEGYIESNRILVTLYVTSEQPEYITLSNGTIAEQDTNNPTDYIAKFYIDEDVDLYVNDNSNTTNHHHCNIIVNNSEEPEIVEDTTPYLFSYAQDTNLNIFSLYNDTIIGVNVNNLKNLPYTQEVIGNVPEDSGETEHGFCIIDKRINNATSFTWDPSVSESDTNIYLIIPEKFANIVNTTNTTKTVQFKDTYGNIWQMLSSLGSPWNYPNLDETITLRNVYQRQNYLIILLSENGLTNGCYFTKIN